MRKTCGSCRHLELDMGAALDADENDIPLLFAGECRALPPQADDTPIEKSFIPYKARVWPSVRFYDWCSHWAQEEDE
jgi:hypothetical protein